VFEDAGFDHRARAWVTVRGPASIIERVQHVTTETLELARVRETITRELELDCDPAPSRATRIAGR
jgi:hypothetical protein